MLLQRRYFASISTRRIAAPHPLVRLKPKVELPLPRHPYCSTVPLPPLLDSRGALPPSRPASAPCSSRCHSSTRRPFLSCSRPQCHGRARLLVPCCLTLVPAVAAPVWPQSSLGAPPSSFLVSKLPTRAGSCPAATQRCPWSCRVAAPSSPGARSTLLPLLHHLRRSPRCHFHRCPAVVRLPDIT